RNKARRGIFDLRVLRPEIIDLMRDACRRLEVIEKKPIYTDRDIEGIGKNFLLETSRKRAIEGYRFYIRYYSLLKFKEEAQSLLKSNERDPLNQILQEPSRKPEWEHARLILTGEFGITDVVSGLRLLPSMLEEVAQSVQKSKAKDDERGARIMDDYADV